MVAVEVGEFSTAAAAYAHRDALVAGVVVGPGHPLCPGDVDLHRPQVHRHAATVFPQGPFSIAVVGETGHLAGHGIGDDAEAVLHVPALGVGDAFCALDLDLC